ncbi:PA1414 family protein [Azotobacter salinestris]|nr:PA1414 family protein [Azotobacter salinestris]
MNAWLNRLLADLASLFGLDGAGRMQPIPLESDERRRLAEERARRR